MKFSLAGLLAPKNSGTWDYLSLLNARFVSQVVGLARGFVVARFLGPADYGLAASARLISDLAKFGNLGFTMVATREATYLKGKGDLKRVEFVKNQAYSCDLILAVALTLFGMGSALFAADAKIALAILIASLGLFFAKIERVTHAEVLIEERFRLFARVTLWAGLGISFGIIGTVPWGGVHAVLGIPVVASFANAFWCWRSLGHRFRFLIQRDELIRQLKIGLHLAAGGLAFGSYRYAERFVVLGTIGVKGLGLYSLANTVMQNLMVLLLTGVAIHKIGITKKLGEQRYRAVHRHAMRGLLFHVLAAAAALPVLWLALDMLVPRILPLYVEAVPLCKVLSIAVVFRNIGPYLQVVLISPLVNKQSLLWPLQLACTGAFVGGCIGLKAMGLATLFNIALLDAVGYAVFHLSYLFLYKRYFYDVYLREVGREAKC